MNGSSDGIAHIHSIKLFNYYKWYIFNNICRINEYLSLVFQDYTPVPSQHWSQHPNCISLSTVAEKAYWSPNLDKAVIFQIPKYILVLMGKQEGEKNPSKSHLGRWLNNLGQKAGQRWLYLAMEQYNNPAYRKAAFRNLVSCCLNC